MRRDAHIIEDSENSFEDEKEALGEPRLVKRIIIKRDLIMQTRLEKYRAELPNGLLLKKRKQSFCNSLLNLYEMLRPKLPYYIARSDKFKELTNLDNYLADSIGLANLEIKELIVWKILLEEFIEFIGITKIEIVKEEGHLK